MRLTQIINAPTNTPLFPFYVQYQNAPKFTQLLNLLAGYLLIPIELFYATYFNLQTAGTQGLNNWGVILNQSNNILVTQNINRYGFENGSPPSPIDVGYPQNFGHGNFSNDTQTTILSNDEYRVLLQFIYSSYVIDCSVRSCTDIINTYIQNQYNNPAYHCYITEGNMTFTYAFNFTLQPFEIAIFITNGKLPRPAGIAYEVTYI
jgi:hypothetical protein